MARRCNSCGLFCSVELEVDSVDATDPDYDDESKVATVEVTAELSLISECCSDTVATASAYEELQLDYPCDHGSEHYSVEVEDGGPTDRYDGKPGTPMRYQRHYYGAEVTATLSCDVEGCDNAFSESTTVEEAASGFDEM